MNRVLSAIFLSAVLLFFGQSNAQVPVVPKVLPKVTLGLKAGMNYQRTTGNTWNNKIHPGFIGGVFAGVTKGRFGIQAEGSFRSVRYLSYDGDKFNTMYVDVPVFLEYRIAQRMWLQIGPQYTFPTTIDNNYSAYFKSSDLAGVIGLQVNLPFHFTVSGRYVLGFTNINNTNYTFQEPEAWHSRSFQAAVGYRFL